MIEFVYNIVLLLFSMTFFIMTLFKVTSNRLPLLLVEEKRDDKTRDFKLYLSHVKRRRDKIWKGKKLFNKKMFEIFFMTI